MLNPLDFIVMTRGKTNIGQTKFLSDTCSVCSLTAILVFSFILLNLDSTTVSYGFTSMYILSVDLTFQPTISVN